MGIGKTFALCALVSIGATATVVRASEITDSDTHLLERSDPRLFALIAGADATAAKHRVHIERWYDHPGDTLPTFVITETVSNTDDAYNVTSSHPSLPALVLPTIVDDPYSIEAFPSDSGTQLITRAKAHHRAYERTYARALSNFESNILDIGRQVARVDSVESGKLRFRQSWVSDSFRIARSEPPEHLIAADQIDNEFFSLRMTRWWNADEHALHVDYYLLVRDVEILPEDEHRFHEAVTQAQNLLTFTVADENAVLVADTES